MQNKPKSGIKQEIIKVRADINEIENRKTIKQNIKAIKQKVGSLIRWRNRNY